MNLIVKEYDKRIFRGVVPRLVQLAALWLHTLKITLFYCLISIAELQAITYLLFYLAYI